MNKIYYLSTCDTCKKILQELNFTASFELHDIKKNPINENELDDLKKLTGSYEALFSKRAQLYKKLNLKDRELTEDDYKKYLLEHYTFLKRPVIVIDSHIFVGNSLKNVSEVKNYLSNNL